MEILPVYKRWSKNGIKNQNKKLSVYDRAEITLCICCVLNLKSVKIAFLTYKETTDLQLTISFNAACWWAVQPSINQNLNS